MFFHLVDARFGTIKGEGSILNEREYAKIRDAINLIAKDIATPEQLAAIVKTYKMIPSFNMAIEKLVSDTCRAYSDNDTMRKYYLEYLRNRFSLPYKSVTEMEKLTLDKMKNIHPGNMSLEENHNLIEETLVNLCNKLNTLGVDYYLVGALPCYIATGTSLTRYHEDIDIMLNEEDIENVIIALQETDYDFQDRRYNNENSYNPDTNIVAGEHELRAQNRNNEFHLGFFPFVRGKEGEMIYRHYFQTNESDEEVTMIWEWPLTLEETQLRYDETPVQYKGTSFRMGSLEHVYSIKSYTQNWPDKEKDQYDIAMLEKSGMLDYDKVKRIQELHKLNSSLRTIIPSDLENSGSKRS